MTPEQKQDPDFFPSWGIAVPLGIQHILAMFVSNVTPAIIIAGAAGFGFGSPDPSYLIYMVQMSMLFAGAATLLQTIGFGPIGARLPIVQGTSFAYLPIMIPIVAGQGIEAMATLMTGSFVGGLFHVLLAPFVRHFRFALPPLVTGLVVAMIGLSLLPIGIQYAAGGVPAQGTEAYGSLTSWALAGIVIIVTMSLKFFGKGLWSSASVLIGLLVGYIVALVMGQVSMAPVETAGWVMVPSPLYFGISFSGAAILGFCFMAIVSAIETIGDVCAITEGGAKRKASTEELTGATYADGIGTLVAAIFGAMPNSSFSQNVGLIAMTGVMSRHIVTIGAVFLIVCGLVPKIGAIIVTVPIAVLGGGVIIMFGMIVSAAVSMLSRVDWTQRNMLIFALSLSISLGLQAEPDAIQHVPETLGVFLTSGVLPAAFLSVTLNLILPKTLK